MVRGSQPELPPDSEVVTVFKKRGRAAVAIENGRGGEQTECLFATGEGKKRLSSDKLEVEAERGSEQRKRKISNTSRGRRREAK